MISSGYLEGFLVVFLVVRGHFKHERVCVPPSP